MPDLKDIDLLYFWCNMPDLKDIDLLYISRDMPDIMDISASCAYRVICLTSRNILTCCAHSEYLQGESRISPMSSTQGRGQRAQQQNSGVCRAHAPLVYAM